MTLRFLLLEDSLLDKELINAQLTEGEILCELVQVETRPEFEAALAQQSFDLILSDYALPNFDGITALTIAQQTCPETPFIFVTAIMGEEVAIETLKEGATDYVLKQRLQRLVPSVKRALREAQERKALARAEQYLRESAVELQRQKEELERVNRIKDEFLAILSHELRSPLNAILGWAELLQTQKLDEATTERAIDTISRNAKLQTQLIEDLLDISRIIRGKLVLESHPTNLTSVILAAIDTVRLSAQAKGIDLHFEPPSPSHGVSLIVLGDFGRLQQIVWNLLTNAIKFTPAGGRVEVKLEKAEAPGQRAEGNQLSVISYQLSEKEEEKLESLSSPHPPLPLSPSSPSTPHAIITVTDTGKGISADFIPYVFESFRQADGSTTRRFGGLGLGLAIARHLVEIHGGTIFVTSLGPEQGATFTVKLPLLKTSPHPPTPFPTPSLSPSLLSNLRILVVDDESDSCDFIAFVLKQQGAIVTSAMSAQTALQIFSSFHPDILVSDIGMPEESGYSLIRKIRLLPPEQGGQVPAIALTAYARDCDRDEAIAAGFHIHQSKPIIPRDLIGAIAQLQRKVK